jgi:hypothetical protein
MPFSISSTVAAFNCFSMRVPRASRWASGFLEKGRRFAAFPARLRFLCFGFEFEFEFGLRCFGETLAGFDSGTVAGDLADEALGMCRADRRLVRGGRQLGVGELGEGAGEGRLMGDLAGMGPAAEPAQSAVVGQDFEQLAGVDEAVNTLGQKGAGDRLAILTGASVPAAGGEQFGDGNHGADGDEERAAIGDGTQDRFEPGKQFLLQDMGELAELGGEGQLHGVGDSRRKGDALGADWSLNSNGHAF